MVGNAGAMTGTDIAMTCQTPRLREWIHSSKVDMLNLAIWQKLLDD